MSKDKEATRYFSTRQESRISGALGWEVVSGSGARDFHPGDIIGPNWLGECKTHVTAGQKIKFDLKVWQKICEEAVTCFRYPVLIVDDGTQLNSHAWVMYPADSITCAKSSELLWTKIVKTNVVFDGTTMKSSYDAARRELHLENSHLVYRIPFGGRAVHVCPFDTFCAMFGEYK